MFVFTGKCRCISVALHLFLCLCLAFRYEANLNLIQPQTWNNINTLLWHVLLTQMHQTGIRPALPVREPYPVAGWPPPSTSSQNVPIRLSKSRRRTILRQLPSHLRGATTPASFWPARLPNPLHIHNLGRGRWCFSSPRVKKVRHTQPLQKKGKSGSDYYWHYLLSLFKSSSQSQIGKQKIQSPHPKWTLGCKTYLIPRQCLDWVRLTKCSSLIVNSSVTPTKCFLSVQFPLSSHPQLKTARILKSLTSRNKRWENHWINRYITSYCIHSLV